MSGLFVRANSSDDIVNPDMRSRFSVSSAGSHSLVDSEEQQASDDQEDVIPSRHKTPLGKSANNDVPRPITTARASLLRHRSRRKGLVFPLSVPVTGQLATGALDFSDDDDTKSETGSDDFDTTLRPQDVISDQEVSTVNHQTDCLVRESLDTIHPLSSQTPVPRSGDVVSDHARASNVTVPWPMIGQDATSNNSSSLTLRKALSASPFISQTCPASGVSSPISFLPSSHGLRRKPAPKLEDYGRLYPTRSQHKTVTTGTPYTFPRSVPMECRPANPSSEPARDTIQSKSSLPRFHATHLRESSPLRKMLLPFSRSSRQATTMPSNNTAQNQTIAGCPPPQLGSPIVLSPATTPSGRARTSSSPPQPTLFTSLDLSYDSRYLSPASIKSHDIRVNPSSSTPILPMPSTPGATPDVSSQFEILRTPRSLGPITPSSSGSVPTTPSRRRIIAFDTMPSSPGLGSGVSSRCSTPLHPSSSARSLRSIASKVRTLPSTIMKRTSSSQTVTQFAYTQTCTQAVSPGFSRTVSPSPGVLGSPWMDSSEPDGTVSPDVFSYYDDHSGSVPSSRHPSRNVSPLPPPVFPYQPGSFNSFAPEPPKTSFAPSHVGSTSSSPRFPPFMSQHMRQRSTEAPTTFVPKEPDGYFRVRSKLGAQVKGVFIGTTSDQVSRSRSKSEDTSIRPQGGSNLKRAIKRKGSFRSFLGLVKRPLGEEEASSGGSSDSGHQTRTTYGGRFLRSTVEENTGVIGSLDCGAGFVSQGASSHRGLGMPHSDLKWYRERLEMEVTMTRCLVETLDAEHARDYKRVQAMIEDVRADIGRIRVPNEGSSDGEESIIDSYTQLPSYGGSVEKKEDAYDSDHPFDSHSRTLPAEGVATDVSSLDQKSRDTHGGEIGYWYGIEHAHDIKS